MVKLRLRVGSKGQIVIPKFVRESLGIKRRGHVVSELREGEFVIKREFGIDELLRWLRETRRPIAKDVSRLSLEDEMLEAVP